VLDSPYRDGFFRALARMGARVDRRPLAARDSAGESIATYTVGPPPTQTPAPTTPGSELRGINVTEDDVSAMIDELPLLACVAAMAAPGEVTAITGASELRVKESDRIAATAANLRAVGATAEELQDGLRIVGTGRRPLRGRIAAHGDHRIAMAFGVLGAVAGNKITVEDPRCVDVSYPGFWNDLGRATGAVTARPGGSREGRLA
jgi:3-phosphoshikimate 1-carboxyvinyltransferase